LKTVFALYLGHVNGRIKDVLSFKTARGQHSTVSRATCCPRDGG